jgi:hypothetical protein
MDNQMTDSRQRVQAALNMALGQYIDQEPQKGCEWRNRKIQDIIEHIEREVAEIKRRTESERMLHDALDLTCLGAILAARILLEENSPPIGNVEDL